MGIDLSNTFGYQPINNNVRNTKGLEKGKALSDRMNYQQIIQDHIDEMYDKIQHGDIEEKFQIGSQSLSLKEWDKLIEKFDKIEEQLQEIVKEETKANEAEAMESEIVQEVQEARELSEEEIRTQAEMLTSESVISKATTADGQEQLHIMWANENGIYCRKAGQTEGYEWSIEFTSKEQYDKAVKVMQSLDPEDKACVSKEFWEDIFK